MTPYRTSARPAASRWGATARTKIAVRVAHLLSRLGVTTSLSTVHDARLERSARDTEDHAFHSYVKLSPLERVLVGATLEYADALKDRLDRHGAAPGSLR